MIVLQAMRCMQEEGNLKLDDLLAHCVSAVRFIFPLDGHTVYTSTQ